jgi:hypothetical protein
VEAGALRLRLRLDRPHRARLWHLVCPVEGQGRQPVDVRASSMRLASLRPLGARSVAAMTDVVARHAWTPRVGQLRSRPWTAARRGRPLAAHTLRSRSARPEVECRDVRHVPRVRGRAPLPGHAAERVPFMMAAPSLQPHRCSLLKR